MLDRLSKNLMGLLFQFVDGSDLLRLEQISKKVSAGAKQDYIWRFLTENTLELAQKFYMDTWKQCYWRNSNAAHHMTPENFNYMMCPIRHFKKIVTFLDCYNNFVIAADESGVVGVFLIDEKDMENDDETLQVHSFQTDGIEYMQLVRRTMSLVIFTKGAQVLSYQIEQTSSNTFTCELKKKIDLPINPANLYITPLDEHGEHFFICNMPLNGEDFYKDQTVIVLNSANMILTVVQKLEFGDDAEDAIQRFYSVIRGLQQPQWGFWVNPRLAGMEYSIRKIQNDKKNYQLAVYNGQKLIFSFFRKNLVVIDTTMSKVELFLKKGNYWQVESFADERTGPAINMKHHQGLILSYNISDLVLLDFNTQAVLQKIPFAQNTQTYMQINPRQDELHLFSVTLNQLHYLSCKIDSKLKTLQQSETVQMDETHQINDVDLNRHLYASATTEGNIKLRKLNDMTGKPYFINAGSKTIKTNIPHPQKPGVSMVKADQSKIIAVLGNVIRVYSFDIKRKKLK